MTIQELRREDLSALLLEIFGQHTTDESYVSSAAETINRWISRGDGVAVYENNDLGHPGLGQKQLVSFGSPDAQLEVSREELPSRLPDIGGNINWRYLLVAIYTGSETL